MLNFDLKTLLKTERFKLSNRQGQMRKFDEVAVFGAGAWGTALAIAFARAGVRVRLWGRNETQIRLMAKSRRNPRYLGDIELPIGVMPTQNAETALKSADAVFLVVPSGAMRDVTAMIRDDIKPGTPVISCTKGLDSKENRLLSELIAEEIPQAEPMFLSGPSFAAEVAENHPTHVVLAGDIQLAETIGTRLQSDCFQIQPEADLVGAQIGGLMKNVVAIACGISDGLEYGSNTRAAIMARGLEEASKLAEAMGGDPRTLLGVSGAGDLALTCTDPQSRNYSYGRSIAQPEENVRAKTFEGAASVKRVCEIMREHKLNAEISFAVCEVLSGETAPDDFIAALFSASAPQPVSQMIAS